MDTLIFNSKRINIFKIYATRLSVSYGGYLFILFCYITTLKPLSLREQEAISHSIPTDDAPSKKKSSTDYTSHEYHGLYWQISQIHNDLDLFFLAFVLKKLMHLPTKTKSGSSKSQTAAPGTYTLHPSTAYRKDKHPAPFNLSIVRNFLLFSSLTEWIHCHVHTSTSNVYHSRLRGMHLDRSKRKRNVSNYIFILPRGTGIVHRTKDVAIIEKNLSPLLFLLT